MSRWRTRIDRIKKSISITQVLADLGYQVRSDGSDREQQFPCDLHGDGRDGKPSARAYPETASWWCFACSKYRDAIETVRAKQGTDFKRAVSYLEQKYGLPTLPWEDEGPVPERPNVENEITRMFKEDRTYSDNMKTIKSNLGWMTQDRELGMDQILTMWEAVDGIDWLVAQGKATENKGAQALLKVSNKFHHILHEEPD